jgi:hypothetical protein
MHLATVIIENIIRVQQKAECVLRVLIDGSRAANSGMYMGSIHLMILPSIKIAQILVVFTRASQDDLVH